MEEVFSYLPLANYMSPNTKVISNSNMFLTRVISAAALVHMLNSHC